MEPRLPFDHVCVFTQRCCSAVLSVPHTVHSKPQRPGSHGTTAEFQALAFVIATNVAAACVRERARVCVQSVFCIGILQHSSAISDVP